MNSEMLKAAKREAESLRAELAQVPAFQKLQRVQSVIDVYEALDKAQQALGAKEPSSTPHPPTRPGSKQAQVEQLVLDHCWKTGRRHTSGQLLKLLTDVGVELGGKVPSKTLSSMLSNSQKLNNVQGFGYGPSEWGFKAIVKDQKNEAPPDKSESASQVTGWAPTLPNLD